MQNTTEPSASERAIEGERPTLYTEIEVFRSNDFAQMRTGYIQADQVKSVVPKR
jgi:hypothetical protein